MTLVYESIAEGDVVITVSTFVISLILLVMVSLYYVFCIMTGQCS